MQLIKLMDDTDTLVVVTDETIQLGDYYINTDSSNRYAYKKIFRAMPTQLKGEPDYFKKWMRKIIGSTKPLKAKGFERYHTTNLTVEEILLLLKNQKLNIMKTAMQMAIEHYENLSAQGSNEAYVIAKFLKEKFLPIERQQIIKSNRDGVDMSVDKKPFITGEEYYNSTYVSDGSDETKQ